MKLVLVGLSPSGWCFPITQSHGDAYAFPHFLRVNLLHFFLGEYLQVFLRGHVRNIRRLDFAKHYISISYNNFPPNWIIYACRGVHENYKLWEKFSCEPNVLLLLAVYCKCVQETTICNLWQSYIFWYASCQMLLPIKLGSKVYYSYSLTF